MVFFGEKEVEFVELIISVAREAICKELGISVEDFIADTVFISVLETIVEPWTITFLVKHHGKMMYEVRIDPAALI